MLTGLSENEDLDLYLYQRNEPTSEPTLNSLEQIDGSFSITANEENHSHPPNPQILF